MQGVWPESLGGWVRHCAVVPSPHLCVGPSYLSTLLACCPVGGTQAWNLGAIQDARAGRRSGERESCSQEGLRGQEVNGGLGFRGQEMLRQAEHCRGCPGNAGA